MREGIEEKRYEEAEKEIVRVAQALNDYAASVNRVAEELEKTAPGQRRGRHLHPATDGADQAASFQQHGGRADVTGGSKHVDMEDTAELAGRDRQLDLAGASFEAIAGSHKLLAWTGVTGNSLARSTAGSGWARLIIITRGIWKLGPSFMAICGGFGMCKANSGRGASGLAAGVAKGNGDRPTNTRQAANAPLAVKTQLRRLLMAYHPPDRHR